MKGAMADAEIVDGGDGGGNGGTVLRGRRQAAGQVACRHENIVQADSDMVCTKCGVVVEDDALPEHGAGNAVAAANADLPQSRSAMSESRPNLYESHALGTADTMPKMQSMRMLQKYFAGGIATDKDRRAQSRLSKLSNTCEKMGLTQMQSQTAWDLFQRAVKRGGTRKTAEAAAWALYQACKMHCVPATSDEILAAVRSNFSRKAMPNMIRILYAFMPSSSDDGGGGDGVVNPSSTISDGCGGGQGRSSTTGAAAGAGAEAAGGDAGGDYYFALNMRLMLRKRKYSEEVFAACKRDAWRMYKDVFTTGNQNVRAKRAIALAYKVGR